MSLFIHGVPMLMLMACYLMPRRTQSTNMLAPYYQIWQTFSGLRSMCVPKEFSSHALSGGIGPLESRAKVHLE